MKKIKDPTGKLIRKLIKAGIKNIDIVPISYMGYSQRPQLFVSFKQFDKLMKKSK